MGPSPALTLPWAHSANPPGRGDIGADVESAFMRDELLTNVSIYWLSGCITSSTRLYYEAMHSGEIGRLSATYCKARSWERPAMSELRVHCLLCLCRVNTDKGVAGGCLSKLVSLRPIHVGTGRVCMFYHCVHVSAAAELESSVRRGESARP